MGIRFGVPRYVYTKPLTYGLEHAAEKADLLTDLSSQNALRLKSRELDVALLTPVDYARNSNEHLIVPNICASSTASRTVLLHLREGLRRINTIAVDIGLTSELVLAKIVLSEKYDSEPQFIPMTPDINTMLAKADAALLVGGPALFSSLDAARTIDLVEEWGDLTDLPYVHALWLSHRNSLTLDTVHSLKQSCEQGVRHMKEIALEASKNEEVSRQEFESYLSSFRFDLDDEAVESISEFYRYAFYYGMLGEVPEIKLYPEELPPDIPLN
jgi:chorismate dehydratase